MGDRIHGDAVRLMRKADKGRLLNPDSYHITMAFLGAVADDRMDSIKAVMDWCKVRDFNLTLMGFSSFKGDKGDLLFREVDGERILYNLQEKLVRLLRREGFILSDQKFIPHITVGRRVYGLSKDVMRAWEAEHIDVSVNAKKTPKTEKAEKPEKADHAADRDKTDNAFVYGQGDFDLTFPAASLCLMETIQEGNGVRYRCLYEVSFGKEAP